jgi:chromosome segregation ATPase
LNRGPSDYESLALPLSYAGLHNDMFTIFRSERQIQYALLDRLETEYFIITAAPQRIEESLDRVEGKLNNEFALREHLEKEIADLKQRVVVFQSRIKEIESRLKTIS